MFEELELRLGEEGTQITLHELEAEVMEVVWDGGWQEFAVRDVLEVLEQDREIAYTTVMTTVKRLFDKGLFDRRKDGRRYLYSPKLDRDEFHAQVAVEVMQSLPESGRRAAVSALVGDLEEVDAETLDRLSDEIERRRRQLGGEEE
ncbi:MAG: BlaI/MecI/CopY family transcriptional regulator [Bradymonadaceae bacterium]